MCVCLSGLMHTQKREESDLILFTRFIPSTAGSIHPVIVTESQII